MGFSLYSLKDTYTTIFTGADVFGTYVLSNNGAGRISWNYSGDMSSHTTTANGYTVINRLVSKNGSISIEVPINSPADKFLRSWIAYLDSSTTPTGKFGNTKMTVEDRAAGRKNNFFGVTPQKKPDESYDQVAGNRQYNLLYAEMTVA